MIREDDGRFLSNKKFREKVLEIACGFTWGTLPRMTQRLYKNDHTAIVKPYGKTCPDCPPLPATPICPVIGVELDWPFGEWDKWELTGRIGWVPFSEHKKAERDLTPIAQIDWRDLGSLYVI